MPFNFINTEIKGLILVEPKVFQDDRGFFLESYKFSDFKAAGIDVNLNQDNYSRSTTGVLRGIHFQKSPKRQAKLVRCVKGEIFDVAVDLREDSETYLKWAGYRLSEENNLMLYIPEGFGHGFIVLSDVADVAYKASCEFSPEHDSGIRWNDPEIGINWGVENPVVSDKDKNLPFLKEAMISL